MKFGYPGVTEKKFENVNSCDVETMVKGISSNLDIDILPYSWLIKYLYQI